MSKRGRLAADLDSNDDEQCKRQKLNEEEEKLQDPNEVHFFTKKVYFKNRIVETRCAVNDNTTYRDKYSANHKYSTRSNKNKWRNRNIRR